MYSQQWSPAPSTTATAPELRTAKRSPATAAAHGETGPLRAVVAPAPSDLPRDARADRAVEVAEVVVPFAAALALDRRQHVAHHALGELAAVEGWVRVGQAELRRIGGQAARGEDGREVELALRGR